MATVKQLSPKEAEAIYSGEVVNENDTLESGFYMLEWEGQISDGSTPSQIELWIAEWVDSATEQNDWIGSLGTVTYSVITPWIADYDADPYLAIFVPVKIKDGEQIPELSLPPGAFSIAPSPSILALMLYALIATSVSVAAVLVLAPGVLRRQTATAGLIFHPDSKPLQDIANEPIPPSQLGEISDTARTFILSALLIVALVQAPKIIPKG